MCGSESDAELLCALLQLQQQLHHHMIVVYAVMVSLSRCVCVFCERECRGFCFGFNSVRSVMYRKQFRMVSFRNMKCVLDDVNFGERSF